MTKIWANSADSHVLEPADLWLQSLPPRLAQRAPRAERGDKYEILYIDGERMDRQLNDFMDAMRPPGARDLDIRLKDLDQEGVWGQLAFPSMGFWTVRITDPELARETVRAWNDWAHAEILEQEPADHPHRVRVHRGHRRRGGRARARRGAWLPGRVPAQPRPPRRGIRARGVGAALGGHGGSRRCAGFHIGTGGELILRADPAAPSSTTSRPRFRASASSPIWWPRECSTVTAA